MHKPAVVVHEGITLAAAPRVLDANKVGAAAVLDGGEHLVGMVSERDLLRSVGHGIDPGSTSIDEVMTRDPVTLRTTDTVTAALAIFRDRRFRHLPVLEGDRVAGILSVRHVVRVAHIEEVQPAGSAPPQPAPPGPQGGGAARDAAGAGGGGG